MTDTAINLPDSYGPLVQELHRRAAERRQPINGSFELTERCNLACGMCYINHAQGDKTQRSSELSSAQWLELARQAVDNGMLFLLLTGGEVFIRPDFFEIYTPLTKMGLIITLFTNGTLITDAIAEQLADAPPNRTEITLYGAKASTYEMITGVPGSYNKCLAGIELLLKYRIPLGLKTILTKHNVGELDEMRNLARSLGLPLGASWLVSKRRDGLTSEAESCRMSAAECVDLEMNERASVYNWTEAEIHEATMPKTYNFYCKAGKAYFVINSNGEMNGCIDLSLPAARPLDIGFRAAWEQVKKFVDEAPPPSLACQNCDIRHFCLRCPAWSQLETGTLSEPVPYLCQIAQVRKERYT